MPSGGDAPVGLPHHHRERLSPIKTAAIRINGEPKPLWEGLEVQEETTSLPLPLGELEELMQANTSICHLVHEAWEGTEVDH